MACQVTKFNDGSWFCVVCNLAGDRDEDPDDYCPDNQPETPEDAPQDRKTAYGD